MDIFSKLIIDCLKEEEVILPRITFDNFLKLLKHASHNRMLYFLVTKLSLNPTDYAKQRLRNAIIQKGDLELRKLQNTLCFCKEVLSQSKIEFLVVRTDKFIPFITYDVDLYVEEPYFKSTQEAFRKNGCRIFSHDHCLGGRKPNCQVNIRRENLLQIDLHRNFTWMKTYHIDPTILKEGVTSRKIAGIECPVVSAEVEFVLNLSNVIYEKFCITLLDFYCLRQALLLADDLSIIKKQVDQFCWRKAFFYVVTVLAAVNEVAFPESENPFLKFKDLFDKNFKANINIKTLPYFFPIYKVLEIFREKLTKKMNFASISLAYYFFGRVRYSLTLKERIPYYDHWYDFSHFEPQEYSRDKVSIMRNKYTVKNIQFYNRGISPLLKEAVIILKDNSTEKKVTLLDLGTGDGVIIQSLLHQHIVDNLDRILGIDVVQRRCMNAARNIRDAHFVTGDALKLPIQDGSIDLVNAWMVIEHVTDDQLMIGEVYRVLKNKGCLIISTVVKKKWSVYFYRRNNKFVLDPTHIREYGSEEEFLTLLGENGFNIQKIVCHMTKYSLLELAVRLFIKLNLVKPQRVRDMYVENSFMFKISQFLQIPVCGFYEIEACCKKV